MRIVEIVSQHRRDFRAVFECEACGWRAERGGYDDDNFHRNVVPAMKCEQCGAVAPDDYRPLGTKHAADEVV